MALFVLLALGAVALGGLSEGRRWSPLLWLAVGLAYPLWFVLCRESVEGWLAAALLVLLHSILLVAGWGRQGDSRRRKAWLIHSHRCAIRRMVSRPFIRRCSAKRISIFHHISDHRFAEARRMAEGGAVTGAVCLCYLLSLNQSSSAGFFICYTPVYADGDAAEHYC